VLGGAILADRLIGAIARQILRLSVHRAARRNVHEAGASEHSRRLANPDVHIRVKQACGLAHVHPRAVIRSPVLQLRGRNHLRTADVRLVEEARLSLRRCPAERSSTTATDGHAQGKSTTCEPMNRLRRSGIFQFVPCRGGACLSAPRLQTRGLPERLNRPDVQFECSMSTGALLWPISDRPLTCHSPVIRGDGRQVDPPLLMWPSQPADRAGLTTSPPEHIEQLQSSRL
jgi:hypothetical protein